MSSDPAEAASATTDQATTEPVESLVDEVSEEAINPGKSLPPIILHVLPLIKDTQRQHGLRHNDYLRYRQYCTRRLQRMRHCLKLTHGKTKYIPRAIEPELAVKDVRYLHILLFDCERAWSYSMQLKQQVAIDPRHAFHSLARLRKAVKHAETFENLVSQCAITDARSQLEVTAYVAWMKASLAFEQQDWADATRLFGQSKIIYDKLHDIVGELQKSLYLQRVEEINANLRYCAHSLGASGDVNELARTLQKDALQQIDSKFDEAVQQSRTGDATSLAEITWEGKTIPIKSEKLRRSLLQARDIEFRLTLGESTHEAVIAIFDELFVEYNDALSLLNTDVQAEERANQKSSSQKSETNLAQLKFLRNYVNFLRLTKTIERNMLIVDHVRSSLTTTSNDTRPDDVVRLYDNLLQNIADLSEIENLKDDLNFAKKIAAQTLYFKAFRCLYIGDSHRVGDKLREAIALYDRATIHSRSAIDHYLQCSFDVKGSVTELRSLIDIIRGRKFSIHAKSFLETQSISSAPIERYTSTKMLVDDNARFRHGIDLKNPQVLPFPPLFEPVACKPLFFDLASHHVAFPSLEQRKQRKTTASVVTGFIKGFFSGSK